MTLAEFKVLLAALPAKLAAVQALLVAVAAGVVPLLPVNVAVKAAAWIATALACLAAIIRVVSSVTPVPKSAQGLSVPEGRVLDVEVTAANGRRLSGIRTTPVS